MLFRSRGLLESQESQAGDLPEDSRDADGGGDSEGEGAQGEGAQGEGAQESEIDEVEPIVIEVTIPGQEPED